MLKCRFPGSLVCTTCARLISSTPAGYANSALRSQHGDNYTCANCRADAQVAAERSARFRALVPRVVLDPPLRIVAPAGEPARHRDESDAAYRRRVERWRQERAASHELLGVIPSAAPHEVCFVDGNHSAASEYARECPLRSLPKSLNTAPMYRTDYSTTISGPPACTISCSRCAIVSKDHAISAENMTQLSEAYVDFIADILINGLEARHGTTRA